MVTLPLALGVVVLLLAVLGALQLGIAVFSIPGMVRRELRARAWRARTVEQREGFKW